MFCVLSLRSAPVRYSQSFSGILVQCAPQNKHSRLVNSLPPSILVITVSSRMCVVEAHLSSYVADTPTEAADIPGATSQDSEPPRSQKSSQQDSQRQQQQVLVAFLCSFSLCFLLS